MTRIESVRALTVLASWLAALFCVAPLAAQNETASAAVTQPPMSYPDLPSEMPDAFEPVTEEFDHIRRDVMIPMRDGVRLRTVILVPKGARGAPILLTRTPYDADKLTRRAASAHLGPSLYGYDNATDVIVEGGYIRVVQDVRGKYGSEGDYVMNRPLRGPQNPSPGRSSPASRWCPRCRWRGRPASGSAARAGDGSSRSHPRIRTCRARPEPLECSRRQRPGRQRCRIH